MTKLKFLLSLHERLRDFPQDEVEERLGFYSEMIEDRMEDGLPEEEAVAAVGTVEEIAAQIASELSACEPANTPVSVTAPTKKKMAAWEIVLLILGAPVWLALLIAVVAVVFSLYVSVWAVIISLWAVFVSLAVSGAAVILTGSMLALGGHGMQGIALVGLGLVCSGLAVFCFYGCKAATAGTVALTGMLARVVKVRVNHD